MTSWKDAIGSLNLSSEIYKKKNIDRSLSATSVLRWKIINFRHISYVRKTKGESDEGTA